MSLTRIFNARLSEDEQAMLNELARRDDRTASGYVRKLIKDTFEKAGLKLPKKGKTK